MQKDFDSWNERKKYINDSDTGGEFFSPVHERDIWWCSMGLNIGSEQDGKNEDFERLVLVLKRFNSRIVLGIPLTSKTKDSPYHFCFDSQGVYFVAIFSQLRLLSTSRFTRRMLKIDHSLFSEIKERIKKVLF